MKKEKKSKETINTEKVKEIEKKVQNGIQDILNTEESKEKYSEEEIKNNTVMEILCYLGILVFIPFLTVKNSKYVEYHAKQGMNLFIYEIFYSVISIMLSSIKVKRNIVFGTMVVGQESVTPGIISAILYLIGTLIGVIAIIGIINALTGKAKDLPLVSKFKFIK